MSPTIDHGHSSQADFRPFASFHHLPVELLQKIVDYIESDPDATIGVDRRQYLSQESFRPPPPPDTAYSRAVDVGHFRLACRKFSEVGARCQFKRVTTRFSKKGLVRLENIASQPHLAKHVKKFSYMVPYFYVEGESPLSFSAHIFLTDHPPCLFPSAPMRYFGIQQNPTWKMG